MHTETNRRGRPIGPLQSRGRRPRLAQRLIARRLALGLSQDAAAAVVGMSRWTWAMAEVGRGPRLPLYRRALEGWLTRS